MTMKSRILAGLSLASFVFLAGCKGFWDLPAGSGGGGGTTPTTLSSGVFYVLNQTTGQIVAYSISSGSLNKIGAYSVPGPAAIAIAPNGNFLYVSTLAAGIYVYDIGSGGALTAGNNGQYISSDPAAALQVDTSNSWLVDAFISPTTGQVQVDAIPLNSNGTYTPGTNVPSASFTIANPAVKQMAISSDDKNVFLALGVGGTLVVPFSSGSLGATAKTIAPANTGGSTLSVAVDPTNRLFYVGETLANASANSGGMRVFNYSSLSSGTLTQATGSPIASGGLAPNAILPIAGGNYVYVANGTGTTSNGNIAWFPITASGTTYTVATGSTIASGIQPIGLAEDSKDNFVLAVATGGSTSSGNPDLEAYTMSSGALTAALKSTTGTDPVGAVAIAALP
jgi:6-phosphogluconolactonase (cycloisomerase 2 family)